MAYTYDKQLWKDYPDTTTPITADRLNHMEDGIFNAAKNGGGESDKIGVIKMFSGSTAPDGWLICDGSLISRTDYSGLFNVIGTSYNLETDTDDTKFRLPNLKGRVPVGLDSEDTDFNTLGKTGGEKEHTLTIEEMPSHNHTMNAVRQWKHSGDHYWVANQDVNNAIENGTTSNTGGGQPHNNLQPYIVLNYIIKASETTPIQAEVIDSLDGNSTINAPSIHAINSVLRNNIITNGNPVKTGRIIDGKDEYVKRYHFTGINSVNAFTKSLGFTLSDVIITETNGTVYSNSDNWLPIPMGDFSTASTYAVRYSLIKTNNTLQLNTANENFKEAYINIKYINIK